VRLPPPSSWRITIEPGRTAARTRLVIFLAEMPRGPVGRVDRPEHDTLAECRGGADKLRGGTAAGRPEQSRPRPESGENLFAERPGGEAVH
jgi:hypothetical protein